MQGKSQFSSIIDSTLREPHGRRENGEEKGMNVNRILEPLSGIKPWSEVSTLIVVLSGHP